MTRRYLVTGGAGFIGSNFVRYLFEHEPQAQVTNLDLLTYAGVRRTIEELENDPHHSFVHGDIGDAALLDRVVPGHDLIVNFAAETHVDRSITDPRPFLEANLAGTAVLLEAARRHAIERFIHVSTDEVYGSLESGFATEDFALRPSSPYAASKAGADLLVHAYRVTYGYPAIVTRCTNNYGPYQFPEKVIPLFVTNLFEGKPVPLYGDGKNERDWLYVEDHCAAIHLLVDQGVPGEVYNVAAGAQLPNIELTRTILQVMGMDDSYIHYVPDRPGHDFRYALDSTKIRRLGWSPAHSFEERLVDTIAWYRAREDWWGPLKEAPSPTLPQRGREQA